MLSRLENVGGELNAFTTKEDICIHGSFLPEYLNRAVELFSDIAFASVYPEKEIEKEKEVIADEINAYREAPDELIFEQAEELVFAGNALGRTILGTEESLEKFTRADILRFIQRNFSPENMIICVSGDYTVEKVKKVVEKALLPYMDIITVPKKPRERITPQNYTPTQVERIMDTHQKHIIISSLAYPVNAEGYIPLTLLNNLLGGPSMTSLLNLELREKHALVYGVDSFYTAYSDTGTAGVYIATDEDTAQRSIDLTMKILKKLREEPLSPASLSTAKKQILGQLAIASENELNQLLGVGKAYMTQGFCDDFSTVKAKIEAVTPQQIMSVAQQIYAPEGLSTLIFTSDKTK
ncbi:MAG: pitrilysin family protein [Flavobacteriales bacterium]|nr:pitrilysin family protein [Flavobacteriales bacterium]